MDFKWIAVMVVGIVLALFGMNKQKQGAAWGQALAIVGALIAVAGAIMNMTNFFQAGSQGMAREKRYMYVQTKFLGEALKSAASPSKVCVIIDPNNFVDEWGDELPQPRQSDWLDGVKAGLGSSVEIIPVYPEFHIKKPANADQVMPPMPYTMMGMRDYKKVCEKIKKIKPDAVVNVYQFPMEAPLPTALAELKGYKIAFLNTSADRELRAAFQDGGAKGAEVVASVLTKVDAVYDETIPAKDQAAFNRRFVLATKADFDAKISEASGSAKK